jgi:hypothetical protein
MKPVRNFFFGIVFIISAAVLQGAEPDPATLAIWKATLDFENVSNTRSQLLVEFYAVATNYPTSQYAPLAWQTVATLTQMVAEDAAHAKTAVTNLDSLSLTDRVQELIFQLRDQNGHQFAPPGSWGVFPDRQNSNSPAQQLMAIGYPAVPQLINALDNPTLTRSVVFEGGSWRYERNLAFPHAVLTVGDCAVAILQRIAGKSFYQAPSSSGYMSNEHKNSETRQAVESWWSDFQKKGEKQMLIEGTEAGNGNSPEQARLLVSRYPDAALAPLLQGTQAANDDYVRVWLMQMLEKYQSPETLTFLEKELRRGTSEPSVTAAAILNHWGKPEALTVMLQDWEASLNVQLEDLHIRSIMVFLASMDSPEAIAALGRGLQIRPANVNARMTIIKVVGETGSDFDGLPRAKLSVATLEAMEALLVSALPDVDQKMGETGSIMGKNYTNPRIGDMAGFFLNQRWPERYPFDLSAPLKERDRQRLVCENTWRQLHNLPVLASPQLSTNHVAAAEATKVVAIEWEAGSAKPSDAFAARIEAMRGKLLSATNFTRVLGYYVTQPEPGTEGLTLSARKDNDSSGVVLKICLLPASAANYNPKFSITDNVTIADKVAYGISGGAKPGKEDESFYGENGVIWNDFIKAINTAINSSPETPFVISAKIEKTIYL